MSKFTDLLSKLHHNVNPYTNYPANQWAGAWYNDPGASRDIFRKSLNASKAGIVVEVGSFVGESAVFMADHLKKQKKDAVIICVDTWYGGIDHYKGAPEKINNHFGRADLYYRFMSNIINRGQQDMILPLAFDSINASRLLKLLEIVPNMIYVDASHEPGDVLRDLLSYWELLPKGGVMLVDDLSNHFPGVVADFTQFTSQLNLKPSAVEGEKAMLIK